MIDGWRYFGYQPQEGQTDADMARGHAEVLLEVLRGEGFAQPSPRPMFPNPPGLLRVEPYSAGLRERIWWGAGSQQTAAWAAGLGMNLQSSTLISNESDKPFHVQQAEQIQAFRDAWHTAGHEREPRISVSRSIFPLVDDRDRAYFGLRNQDTDQIGFIDATTEAIFGRSYAAEPEELIRQLKEDEGDRGCRHAAAHRAQPARCRLQRPHHRQHPDPGGARARLAISQAPPGDLPARCLSIPNSAMQLLRRTLAGLRDVVPDSGRQARGRRIAGMAPERDEGSG